jgi:hypothetical protein
MRSDSMSRVRLLAVSLVATSLLACPSGLRTVADGQPCDWNEQCAGGVCLPATSDGTATGWTGGTCTRPCVDSACNPDEVCVDLGGAGACLPRCLSADGGETACRSGYICNPTAGTCLPDCRNGWSCGELYTCQADGTCGLPAGDAGTVGAPCTGDVDCTSGICFAETENGAATGWTGGSCAAVCDGDGGCVNGGACAVLSGKPWCLESCGDGSVCREGYVCDTAFGTCLPDCHTTGWSCGTGFACTADGQCEVAASTLAAVGAPCTAASDCASGICFAQTEDGGPTGWTGGTCADVCVDGVCSSGACSVLSDQTWCLEACTTDTDCRTDYVCDPDYKSCLPNCENAGWSCGSSLTCSTTGHCVVPQTDLSPDGAPCSGPTDCESGQCFPASTGWTAGMCVDGCASAGACPVGAVCTEVNGGQWCVEACVAGACRSGYVCETATNACLPDCSNSGYSCPSGETCGTDGRCEPSGTTLSSIGQSCSLDTDCESGMCDTEPAYTGGSCTQPCTVGTSGSCPTDAVCLMAPGGALCVAACNTTTSCRTGYVCAAMQGGCVPNCNNSGAMCPTGATCNSQGLCVQ